MRRELEAIERIVVALASEAPATDAIEAAAALARSVNRPLAALWVENEQLLRLAALPRAIEIGYPSALGRVVQRGAIERDLRSRAERIRRLLSETAQRMAVEATLQVVQGNLLREALRRLAPHELLVVWRGARFGEYPLEQPARAAGVRRVARSVAVVAASGEAGVRALLAAYGLAAELAMEVLVLGQGVGGDARRRLRAQAEYLLGPRRAQRLRMIGVGDLAPESTGRLLRAERAGMLIMPRGAIAEALLEAYCAQAACPIGLVA